MKKILLKEEVILTRDEVRNLLSSVPEGCIIDFSNVEFVSLSAAHEFRKLKRERNLRLVNMKPIVKDIFRLDKTVRERKQTKTRSIANLVEEHKVIKLEFPSY